MKVLVGGAREVEAFSGIVKSSFEALAASQEFGRIKTPCLSRDTCEHGANNGADFYHATLKSVHPGIKWGSWWG